MDDDDDSSRDYRDSKRLSCTCLEREEYKRDERLVLDLCGNDHCDPDDQMTEVDRRRLTRSYVTTSNKKVSRSGLCVEPYDVWYGITDMRSVRIVWTITRSILTLRKLDRALRDVSLRCSDEILPFVWRLSRSCANSQIVHRREEIRRFHVDHVMLITT